MEHSIEISALTELLIGTEVASQCPLASFIRSVKEIAASCIDEDNLGDVLLKFSAVLSEQIKELNDARAISMRTCEKLRQELICAESQLSRLKQREEEATEFQKYCKSAVELYFSKEHRTHFEHSLSIAANDEMRFEDELRIEDMNTIGLAPLPHPSGKEVSFSIPVGSEISEERKVSLNNPPPKVGLEQPSAAQALVSVFRHNSISVSEPVASEILGKFAEVCFNAYADWSQNLSLNTSALVTLAKSLKYQTPTLQIGSLKLFGLMFHPSFYINRRSQFMHVTGCLLNDAAFIHTLVHFLSSLNDNVKCESLEYISYFIGTPQMLPIELTQSLNTELARQEFMDADGLSPLMSIVLNSTSEAVLERALVLLWGLLSKDEFVDSKTKKVFSLRLLVRQLGGLQVLDLWYSDSLAILENSSIVVGYITRDESVKQDIRINGGLEKIVAMLHHPLESIKTRMTGAIWNCASVSANRHFLRNIGAIPSILEELSSALTRGLEDELFFENAVGALWSLSVDTESKEKILAYDGVRILCQVLEISSCSQAVVEATTGTLWNCSSAKVFSRSISEANGVPSLVNALLVTVKKEKLNTVDKAIMEAVVGTLRNCVSNTENRAAIIDCGGVEALAATLHLGETSKLSAVCWEKISIVLWVLTASPEGRKKFFQTDYNLIFHLLERSSPVLAFCTDNNLSQSAVLLNKFIDGSCTLSEESRKMFCQDCLKSIPSLEPSLSISMKARSMLVNAIHNCSTAKEYREQILAAGAVRVIIAVLLDCYSEFCEDRVAKGKRGKKPESGVPIPGLCEAISSTIWHLSRADKETPVKEGALEVLYLMLYLEDPTFVLLNHVSGAFSSFTAAHEETSNILLRIGGVKKLLQLIETADESRLHPAYATKASAYANILTSIRNATTISESVLAFTIDFAIANSFRFVEALMRILQWKSEDCVRQAVSIIKNLCSSTVLRKYFLDTNITQQLAKLIRISESKTLRRGFESTLRSLSIS